MPQENDGEGPEVGDGSQDLFALVCPVLQLSQESAFEVHPVFRKTRARERVYMEILPDRR